MQQVLKFKHKLQINAELLVLVIPAAIFSGRQWNATTSLWQWCTWPTGRGGAAGAWKWGGPVSCHHSLHHHTALHILSCWGNFNWWATLCMYVHVCAVCMYVCTYVFCGISTTQQQQRGGSLQAIWTPWGESTNFALVWEIICGMLESDKKGGGLVESWAG